jgi:hypothetical protein
VERNINDRYSFEIYGVVSILHYYIRDETDKVGVLLLNNLRYNEDPNDPCMYCTHHYSVHFSDDVHGLGSKDFKVYIGDVLISILMVVNVHARVSNHH